MFFLWSAVTCWLPFEVLHSLWLSTGVRFEVFCLNVLCIVSLRRRFPLDCSCSAFDLRHVTTENVMFDFLPIFLQALVWPLARAVVTFCEVFGFWDFLFETWCSFWCFDSFQSSSLGVRFLRLCDGLGSSCIEPWQELKGSLNHVCIMCMYSLWGTTSPDVSVTLLHLTWQWPCNRNQELSSSQSGIAFSIIYAVSIPLPGLLFINLHHGVQGFLLPELPLNRNRILGSWQVVLLVWRPRYLLVLPPFLLGLKYCRHPKHPLQPERHPGSEGAWVWGKRSGIWVLDGLQVLSNGRQQEWLSRLHSAQLFYCQAGFLC